MDTRPQTTARSTEDRSTQARARPALARGVTVLAAAVTALVGWVLAHVLLDIELHAQSGAAASTREVGAVDVVVAGLVVGLAAWLLLWVLERITTRPRTVWTVLAVAVLVFSLSGPLAATTVSASIALMGLHVLVGVVLVIGFRRTV